MHDHAVQPVPLSHRAPPLIVNSTDGEDPIDGTARQTGGLRRRAVALGVSLGVVVAGVLFYFLYDPVFRHSATWTDPIDLWGTFRAAHYVGWGYLGGIYRQETGVVTFPGLSLVLAPVAILSDTLHMSSSIGPFRLAHPTAALLLVPTVLVLASTVVVAADALADELGVGAARRAVVALLVGAMAWASTIVWGHPEDALVMTFACWAMVAVLRNNWRRAGWLLGVGIAFQPLIVLIVPPLLASTPSGQRIVFVVRCSVLSAFLVGIAFVGDPSGTYRALVDQPTPPYFNHATPWVSLAPHVLPSGAGSAAADPTPSARGAFVHVASAPHALLEVAAGPGRTAYLVLAVLVGFYVCRRPQNPVRLLWLAGAVLGARCYFEAVMTPYYLTPPLILLLVLAAGRGKWRFAGSAVVAAGVSWFAYWHLNPWVWWPPVAVGMTLVMVLSRPPGTRTGRRLMESMVSIDAKEGDDSRDLVPIS